MSRFTFILNPIAGKGSGRRIRDNVDRILKQRTSDFELLETRGPGDATEIARHSSSPIVVAVGGDGTIHEVANGIIGSQKVLGVIPVGSGNDFIKSVGVPKDLSQSISTILLGKTTTIDVGRVEVEAHGSNQQSNSSASFFVNGLGIGFDAAVAEQSRHVSIVSGSLVYLVAVLQTLGRYRSPQFFISIDGKESTSRNLLIALGNGKCAGGGFYLTPDAKVDDGILDICLIKELSTLGILRLMPRVLKGKHREEPCVRFEKGQHISITASSRVSVHSDGEILSADITRLQIDVVPKALSVIVA